MIGAVLVVFAMLVVLPTAIWLLGAVWSAVLGQFSTLDAEERAAAASEPAPGP